ncbi:MAG: hypothetical protein ACUVQ3_03660 [bacterium]
MRCPKCGWENVASSKNCFQCGTDLSEKPEISLEPVLKTRKPKFSLPITRKGYKKHPQKQNQISPSLFTSMVRKTTHYIPTYLDIVLVTLCGFFPGFAQFLQHRRHIAFYLLMPFFLLVILFILFIRERFTTYLLYVLIALAICSSCDAVFFYFSENDLRLNPLIKSGIVLTAISFLYLLALIVRTVLGIFFVFCHIDTTIMQPQFKKDDVILAIRQSSDRVRYIRSEPVIINSIKYPRYALPVEYGRCGCVCTPYVYVFQSPGTRLTTIAFIVGLPGERIKIENGNVFRAEDRDELIALPVSFKPDTSEYFASDSHAYVVLTYNSGYKFVFEQIHETNILGKPFYVINPPQNRRFIR